MIGFLLFYRRYKTSNEIKYLLLVTRDRTALANQKQKSTMASFMQRQSSAPSEEELNTIYDYMIEHNLSSYSDRADCVDDDSISPAQNEYMAHSIAYVLPSENSQETETYATQEEEEKDAQEEEDMYEKCARLANEFSERRQNNTLTEEDKEELWRYGSEDEVRELGDWQPPAVSLLNHSDATKRQLEGFKNLMKDAREAPHQYDDEVEEEWHQEEDQDTDFVCADIYEQFAQSASDLVEHNQRNTLTEVDKEWIWYYGTGDDRNNLGNWQPQERLLQHHSEVIQRRLDGFQKFTQNAGPAKSNEGAWQAQCLGEEPEDPAVLAIYERIEQEANEFLDRETNNMHDQNQTRIDNLEKEINERNWRFERGEETPADIMWRMEMGLLSMI